MYMLSGQPCIRTQPRALRRFSQALSGRLPCGASPSSNPSFQVIAACCRLPPLFLSEMPCSFLLSKPPMAARMRLQWAVERVAGKTQCQGHSRGAYFLASRAQRRPMI
jgi:hypothetical protein